MGKPVVHFDIGCKNLETVTEFYCKLFDWSSSENGSLSQHISTNGGKGIDGAITSLGHEPHNYVMMYMEVEDVAEYVKKTEDLGGKMLIPPTDVPEQGQFAWMTDPEGNMFGLWKPLK